MQLGWIDFSKTERNKILSVLDLLSESGTLDELGIAPVRDGFSNLFFPGTSTIQTRAKYFFAVPYALKQLEKDPETNPNKVLKALDALERSCGELLFEQNKNENGIIGKNSLQNGRWVKRTPASIYWAGLRKYGIFTGGNMSLSEYIKASCVMKAKKNTLKSLGNRNDNAEEYESDDKNAGDLFKMQFWKMPLYTDDWLENFNIKLTSEEAAFLREQIINHTKGSMLAFVLENEMTEFLECKSFQDLNGIIEKFPDEMQDNYFHALAFSDYIFTVRTIYNVMVSDGENEDANIWMEELVPNFAQIAEVDIDGIFERLEIRNNPMLRKFLKQIQQLMIDNDLDGLKECIRSREINLKGINRAKTAHAGEFDPVIWYGGGELDYRFSRAKIIIRDIMEGEGKLNAESE